MLALPHLTGRSPVNVALPFLVKGMQANVGGLGLLYSAFSAGSIVGTLAVGMGRTSRRRGVLVYALLVVVGLDTMALGLSQTLLMAAAAMLVLGLSLAVTNLTWAVILQQRVEPGLLGRVASINLLESTGLLPIGYWLAGAATGAFGPAWVFAVGGALTAVCAASRLLLRSIRQF